MYMLLAFVGIGSILYVVDRVFGVSVKRGLYNATHGIKLAARNERGFVYRIGIKSRVSFATTLVAVQLLLGVFVFHLNPASEILWSIVAIPCLVGGFYLGPYLDRLFGNANALLDQAETLEQRIERGETTLGQEAGRVARTAGDRLRSTVTGEKPVTPAPDPKEPEPVEPDPKKAYEKFVR